MSAASQTSGAAGPRGTVLALHTSPAGARPNTSPAGARPNTSPAGARPNTSPAGARPNTSPWVSFVEHLKNDHGPEVYESWFGRLGFEGIADGLLTVSLPTKFLCYWIKQHYGMPLAAAARAVWPEVARVAITMRGTVRQPPAGAGKPAPLLPVDRPLLAPPGRGTVAPFPPAPAAPVQVPSGKPGHSLENPQPLTGARLDPKQTLTAFIAGEANRLAHAAAVHLAGIPGEAHRSYSVLFVHGAPGRGKTHLLQGTAAHARRFALYLNAQRLGELYGESCDHGAAAASSFLQRGLEGRELVLIDDLDLIAGACLRDFASLLIRFVLDTGRCLIVSAAVPPVAIEGWERALLSRLSGGLVCGMEAMGPAARVAMAHAMQTGAVQEGGAALSDAVTTALGLVLGQDGHLLRGGLTKARALQAPLDRELTAAEALAAVADLKIETAARAPTIDAIIDAVALFYDVTRHDILSSRRTANVVLPRHVAMYLAKVLTPRSLPGIGQRFGGRDHTTVLCAVRKIERLAKTDAKLAGTLKTLGLRLGGGT